MKSKSIICRTPEASAKRDLETSGPIQQEAQEESLHNLSRWPGVDASPDSPRAPGPVPAQDSPPPRLPLQKPWAPWSTRLSPKFHLLPPLHPKTNKQNVGVKVGLKTPFGYVQVHLYEVPWVGRCMDTRVEKQLLPIDRLGRWEVGSYWLLGTRFRVSVQMIKTSGNG